MSANSSSSGVDGPTIDVIVSPSGETTVRTRGFAGPSCRDASRFLEQALGEKDAEHFTPEFFQAAANPQRVGQG